MSVHSEVKPGRLFAECIIIYMVTLVFTRLSHVVTHTPAAEAVYVCVLLSLMFLPLAAMRFVNRRTGEASGAEIVLSGRDAAKGLLMAVVLSPFVFLGAWIWFSVIQGYVFSPSLERMRQLEGGVLQFVLTQIILVAMPEEFFYRGYLMTTLRDGLLRRFSWSKRKTNAIVILVVSMMLAAAHTLEGDLGRLNTFCPALLFGVLRIRSEGILGCILLHAGCNVMMQLVITQFIFVHSV